MDLSIIIVNYNVKEFLQNLLNSLEKASRGLKTEVIVVDNASDDGSVEILREKYPGVKLIANRENVGFGKANNQGMKIASGKYFLLINPDTIVREDSFHKLITFFEQTPEAGMAGCKVLNPDGSLQLPCRRSFPGPWTSFTKVTGLSSLFPKSKLFARYNLTYLDENETYEVDAISGAFMMFRREVYETTGGFDPVFFMYGEDLDLCYRTQTSGWKVYYVPTTEIIHYKGESTKRSNLDETRVFYDAMNLFVKKHFSTSFLTEAGLRLAISLRKAVAFLNVYRIPILALLLDFLIFPLCVLAAETIYLIPHGRSFPAYSKPWIYIVPTVLQSLIFFITGAYDKKTLSVFKALIGLFFGFILLSTLTYFFKQFAFSRAVVLITYAGAFLLLPLWRLAVKIIFNMGISSDFRNSRTLIVGNSPKSAELADKLKSSFLNIYQVVGLIGFSRREIGTKTGNYEIVGSLDNIVKVIHDQKINKVIFSSEKLSFEQIFSVVSANRKMNAEFLVAGSNHDFLVGKSSTTMLENIPLFTLNYRIMELSNRIIKRTVDLIVGISLLIFVYPFVSSKNNSFFAGFIKGLPDVIKGKKSLVGPVSGSTKENVYLGKPGLTGLWQIGSAGSKDREETAKLDLYYARNQNFWLDVEILGKSFAKMFGGKGI